MGQKGVWKNVIDGAANWQLMATSSTIGLLVDPRQLPKIQHIQM